jgi:hypothetical protein
MRAIQSFPSRVLIPGLVVFSLASLNTFGADDHANDDDWDSLVRIANEASDLERDVAEKAREFNEHVSHSATDHIKNMTQEKEKFERFRDDKANRLIKMSQYLAERAKSIKHVNCGETSDCNTLHLRHDANVTVEDLRAQLEALPNATAESADKQAANTQKTEESARDTAAQASKSNDEVQIKEAAIIIISEAAAPQDSPPANSEAPKVDL